jgi:ABC-type sugar transport system ATPase subunit
MGLRPESIYVYESANLYPIKAAISAVEPMGNESFIYFDIEDWQWVLRTTKRTESLLSGNTNLFIDAGKAHFFDFITEKAI